MLKERERERTVFVRNDILVRNTPVGRRGFVVRGVRCPVAGMGRGIPGCQYGGFVEALAVGDRVRRHDGPDLPGTCFYHDG